ncbi:MAG: putative Ig domain-containing protein, partial [Tropheryma whipplei]|nr:putative Ig domain-containing protein [Tropheryma whipplei]
MRKVMVDTKKTYSVLPVVASLTAVTLITSGLYINPQTYTHAAEQTKEASQQPVDLPGRDIWLPKHISTTEQAKAFAAYFTEKTHLPTHVSGTDVYVKTYAGPDKITGTISFTSSSSTTPATGKYPSAVSFLNSGDHKGWLKVSPGSLTSDVSGTYTATAEYKSADSSTVLSASYTFHVYDEYAVTLVTRGEASLTSALKTQYSGGLSLFGTVSQRPPACRGVDCVHNNQLSIPQGLQLVNPVQGILGGTVTAAPGYYTFGLVDSTKRSTATINDIVAVVEMIVQEHPTLDSADISVGPGSQVSYDQRPFPGRTLGGPDVTYTLTDQKPDKKPGQEIEEGKYTLPSGLSFNSTTGRISGTVSKTQQAHTYPLTVRTHQNYGELAKLFDLKPSQAVATIVISVVTPPRVTYGTTTIDSSTGTITSAIPTNLDSQALKFSIRTKPYGLDALSIDPFTGALRGNIDSGNRLYPVPPEGVYRVVVEAKNQLGQSAYFDAPVTVGEHVSFVGRPIPSDPLDKNRTHVVAGVAYSLSPASGNQDNPLSQPTSVSYYRLADGTNQNATTPGSDSLPKGLSLNPNTGTISGTVASTGDEIPASGTYSFRVIAVSLGGEKTEVTYTLRVEQPFVAGNSTVYVSTDQTLDKTTGVLTGIVGGTDVTVSLPQGTNQNATTPGSNSLPKGLSLSVSGTGESSTASARSVHLTGKPDGSVAPGRYLTRLSVTSGGVTKTVVLVVVVTKLALKDKARAELETQNISVYHQEGQPSDPIYVSPPALAGVDGETVIYTLKSGSTLPAGLSLGHEGRLTGRLLGATGVSQFTVTISTRHSKSSIDLTYKITHLPVSLGKQTVTTSQGGTIVLPPSVTGLTTAGTYSIGEPDTKSKKKKPEEGATSPDTHDKLPKGLHLSHETGTIYGVIDKTVKTGVYSFPLTLTYGDDKNKKSVSAVVEIYVTQGDPIITPKNLVYYKGDTNPVKVKTLDGQDFSGLPITPTATDTNTYTWSLYDSGSTEGTGITPADNTLPRGLSLDKSTGKITGTIDSSVEYGTYTFRLRATNATGGYGVADISLIYVTKPHTTPISPVTNPVYAAPGGRVSIPQLDGKGGFKYTLVDARDQAETVKKSDGPVQFGLPTGLSLNPETGYVSGTVGKTVLPGTYVFGVKVSADSLDTGRFPGSSETIYYALTVTTRPVLESVDGPVYKSHHVTIPANLLNAGTGTTFSLSGSSSIDPGVNRYPQGLSIDQSTGTLTGSVSSANPGSYTFRVLATTDGVSTEALYHLTVKTPPPFPTTTYSVVAGYTPHTTGREPLKDRFSVYLDLSRKYPSYTWTFGRDTVQGTTPGENTVPLGLVLYSSEGALIGNVDKSVKPGLYSFDLVALDNGQYVSSLRVEITVFELDAVEYPENTLVKPGQQVSITPKVPTDLDQARKLTITAGSGAVPSLKPGDGRLPLGLTITKPSLTSSSKTSDGLGAIQGVVDPRVEAGEYTAHIDVFQATGEQIPVGARRTVLVKIRVEGQATLLSPTQLVVTKQGASVSFFPHIAGGQTFAFANGTSSSITPGPNRVPAGLGINPDTGLVQGTLGTDVEAGRYTFGITATGSPGTSPVTLQVTLLVSAIESRNYSVVAGRPVPVNKDTNTTGYTYALSSSSYSSVVAGQGRIPRGITLDRTTGNITGTVGRTVAAGLYTFGVDVFSARGSRITTVMYSVSVTDVFGTKPFSAAVTLGTQVSLPSGQDDGGSDFSFVNAAWSTTPGPNRVPRGVFLDPSTGSLKTLNPLSGVQPGIYTFTLSFGPRGRRSSYLYTLAVLPPVTLSALQGDQITDEIAIPSGITLSGLPKEYGIVVGADGSVTSKAITQPPGIYSLPYTTRYYGQPLYTSAPSTATLTVSSVSPLSADVNDVNALFDKTPEESLKETLTFAFARGTSSSTTPGPNRVPAGLGIAGPTGRVAGFFKTGIQNGVYTFTVDISTQSGKYLGSRLYTITIGAPGIDATVNLVKIAGIYQSTSPVIFFPPTQEGTYSLSSTATYSATPGPNRVPLGLLLGRADGSLTGSVYGSSPGVYTFLVESTYGQQLYRLTLKDTTPPPSHTQSAKPTEKPKEEKTPTESKGGGFWSKVGSGIAAPFKWIWHGITWPFRKLFGSRSEAPSSTTNATGNTNGKTRVKRGAQKPPDHPL